MEIKIKKGRWFYHLFINGECVKCSGVYGHILEAIKQIGD